MCGKLIRITGRRWYNYNTLGASTETSIVLAEGIDAIDYDKAELIVRVHNFDVDAQGEGRIKAMLISDCRTPDAPGEFFAGGGGMIVMTGGDTEAGNCKHEQFTTPLGATLAVALSFSQDPNTQLALNAELSIDLVLKGA